MIPSIEDILAYYKAGDCTLEKALGWIEQHQENTDLRDHFAGLAMQGYIVGTEAPKCAHIASVAYEMSDAMLKARKP